VLGGNLKAPRHAFPALNNNTAKARPIKGEKKVKFPHGQGLTGGPHIYFCKRSANAPAPGVYHQYLEDLKLPTEEQCKLARLLKPPRRPV
jgi:hypothetical protein